MRSKDPTRPRKVIEGVTEDMGAINELVTEMIENANPLLYRMLTFYSANKPKYASKRVTYRGVKGSRRAPAIPESDPAYKPDNSKGIVKIANQGSSRSGKTWTVAQFIFLWCYWNYNKANTSGKYIAVWRDTAVDCSKNTYKDFEECFKYLGVWDICSVTTAPRPKIRLFGNTIEFMGLPEPGKQAPRTDISFFNEVVETADPHRVAGIVMRCQYAAIYDWNPSYTSHWVFGLEDEMNEGKNVLFTRTSYLDNPNLPEAVVMNIEALCPWKYDDPEECEVYLDEQGFRKRRWLKPERPEGCPLSEYHLYRADNLVNLQAGTADRWRWLVYGEGIPAAKEGAVFDPGWIDTFPENLDLVGLSLDFGYSCFRGDTLIRTSEGNKPISNIREGDLVLSQNGFRSVKKLHKNGLRDIVIAKIYTDFGYSEIFCTLAHEFKTKSGWKQLKDLAAGQDELFMTAFSKGLNTPDTPTVNTQDTFIRALAEVKSNFTELFGRLLLGRYQRVCISTTLMAILSIILSKILCFLLLLNIQGSTITLKILAGLMDLAKKIGQKEEKKLLNPYPVKSENVNGAGKSTPLQILTKYRVVGNVITSINILPQNLMKRMYVHSVAEVLKGINTLNKKHAQKNAPTEWRPIRDIEIISKGRAYVYDLEVEQEHCYFANGILVHNCDPSVLVRSGCNRREKTLYSECLMYHPTPDPDSLFAAIEMPLWGEVRRQLAEAMPFDWMYQWDNLLLNESRAKLVEFTKTAMIKPKILVACDSKDVYKDEEFVLQLNSISSQKGYRWQFVKVQKPRIAVRISLMKRFRHLVVKDKNVEIEAQNYVYEIVDGKPTNIPVDKFNHFWDALGYAVIYFYKWLLV